MLRRPPNRGSLLRAWIVRVRVRGLRLRRCAAWHIYCQPLWLPSWLRSRVPLAAFPYCRIELEQCVVQGEHLDTIVFYLHELEGRRLSFRVEGLNCCGSNRCANNKHSQSYGHSSTHRALLTLMKKIRNALKAVKWQSPGRRDIREIVAICPPPKRPMPRKGDSGTS